MIATASQPPKPESVYREIRARIQRGRYRPGYRLVIDQLAWDFAVSAIPVREAVRRLAAERRVAHTPHVGFQVVAQDPRATVDTLQLLAVAVPPCGGMSRRRPRPRRDVPVYSGLESGLRCGLAPCGRFVAPTHSGRGKPPVRSGGGPAQGGAPKAMVGGEGPPDRLVEVSRASARGHQGGTSAGWEQILRAQGINLTDSARNSAGKGDDYEDSSHCGGG